jgi:hypothetical protein
MVTIRQFLCGNPETIDAAVHDLALHVRVAALEDSRSPLWETFGASVKERLAELLDISFVDVMLRGWQKYALIRKYTSADAAPSDETILIPLSEHTIHSEHNPHIEILRGGRELARISFSVIIELHLDGFVLKIRNRRIEEVQAGRLTASGGLKCEGVTLAEKELQPVELPGSIRLPLDAAAAGEAGPVDRSGSLRFQRGREVQQG